MLTSFAEEQKELACFVDDSDGYFGEFVDLVCKLTSDARVSSDTLEAKVSQLHSVKYLDEHFNFQAPRPALKKDAYVQSFYQLEDQSL